MNIHYIYAHPVDSSLNASLKQVGKNALEAQGHHVVISDLYAQQFMPTFDLKNKITPEIAKEMENILQADHLIFQFPLWWFSMPAIMKGWFDRVFLKGFAYDTERTFDAGPLRGKSASLVITTLSPATAYQPQGAHGAPISDFILPIHHTLRFTGISPLAPFITYGAINLDALQVETIKNDYRNYLSSY